MSLVDNIVEEFKNDIIIEIIKLKQKIIILNREKDEEINNLKKQIINLNREKDEEINNLKQELNISKLKNVDYLKEILSFHSLCKKLRDKINELNEDYYSDEKNNYDDLMYGCEYNFIKWEKFI